MNIYMYQLRCLATLLLFMGMLSTSSTSLAALEEIVVTANKRAENANDIGLSISAVTASKLEDQKLTSLEEITTAVPGLVFATSQQNTPILTLRGVGFNESSLGVYPATSLYVDEVPLPFPAMAAHSAFDLERAEVLKGPQGVLFGQNSTGGAVNFIANKPTEIFGYGGDISYGSFSRLEVNGFVNGALSESVNARISVQSVDSDDWQESVSRPGDENGKEEYTAARLQLSFAPNETSEINFNLNGWTDNSDPQALQLVAITPKRFDQAAANAQAQFALPLSPETPEAADWSLATAPSGDKEFLQASLRGDFDISDSSTVTGILAYSDYEQNQVLDGDGAPLVLADFFYNEGSIESTFAELRLTTVQDNFRLVVGANYEDSSTFEEQFLSFGDNTTTRPQAFFIHTAIDPLEQDIESFAGFVNIDYDLNESLTTKLGVRYTDTTIDAVSCNRATANLPGFPDASGATPTAVDDGSNVAAIFNFLGGLSGQPFTPIGVNDCFTLNDSPLVGIPGEPFQAELAEDNVSWRVGLDYHASNDALLYANISQGYKAGSFPVLAANDFSQLQPVTEESVLAYEAGFKMSLMENSMQWNGALFHYDYEDKQVRGKVDIALFGPLDRLVNVPESTITGFETDIVAQLNDKLTLTAALTYLDSEVKEYSAADGAFDVFGNNRDLSGGAIPFTPELSYTLDLDYRTSLANGAMLFAGFNITGQDESIAVFDGETLSLADSPLRDNGGVLQNGVQAGVHRAISENYFVIDSYAVAGARLGYESADGRWRVVLWGKNITDEYYYNSVVASSEGGGRIAGKPRTYGLTFGFNY